MGVVLASKGYPGSYDKGHEIIGIENSNSHVYHMGTLNRDNRFFTNGGRVLMVVDSGATVREARDKVYAAVAAIKCDNLFYRTDIAHQALTPLELHFNSL